MRINIDTGDMTQEDLIDLVTNLFDELIDENVIIVVDKYAEQSGLNIKELLSDQ